MTSPQRFGTVAWKAAVSVGLAALAFSSCKRAPIEPTLPTVPSTLQLREFTVTTKGIDHSRDALVSFSSSPEATTSTIAFATGRVTFSGTVVGPNGPVEGATVHFERLVADQVAAADVVTDSRGKYELASVEGGRVRIRAWRSPDMAAVEPVVKFASGAFNSTLRVKKYGGTSIRWAIAPTEPVNGRAANMVIQATIETVTIDGLIRPEPVVGVGITVTPLGLLQSDLAQEVVTDNRGRVQVALRCNGVGASTLLVTLATGESSEISPPPCAPVPTTIPPVPQPTSTTTTLAPVVAAVTVAETTPPSSVEPSREPVPIQAVSTTLVPTPP